MFESSDKYRRIAFRSAVKGIFYTMIIPLGVGLPLYINMRRTVDVMRIPISISIFDVLFNACLLFSFLFVLYLYKKKTKLYYSPMYFSGQSFEIDFQRHIIAKSTLLYVGAFAISLLSVPNYLLSLNSIRYFIFLLLPIIAFFLIRPSRHLIKKVYQEQQKLME